MNIMPNQPAPQPVRMPGWLRGLLIAIAVATITLVAVVAVWIAAVLLTYDGTGWM